MQIAGSWLLFDDGVTRPVIDADIHGANGPCSALFLVDCGADQTVFSNATYQNLGVEGKPPNVDFRLLGISGAASFVLLASAIEFTRDDGGPARVRGEFAAFTDPYASDLNILGRDVLNNFDVILSRRRNEVLLLAPNHQYRVVRE
jgi:hypothetical protein